MSFELGVLHAPTPHLFADLAELLLFTNNLGKQSLARSDLVDLFNEALTSDEDVDLEDTENQENEFNTRAEISQRKELQVDDLFQQLEYRVKVFGDAYPFTLQNQLLTLHSTLNNAQKIYCLLLCCSRLRSFQQDGLPQKWARHFTNVSRVAMQGLLPHHAVVHIFDANSEDRRNIYGTNLKQAIPLLGKKWAVDVALNAVEQSSTSGDAGIDLVGYIDFADNAKSNYALVGQCGANEINWPSKTLEAHPVKIRRLFSFLVDPTPIFFTPILFRSTTGGWVSNLKTAGVYLIDRLRLLRLLLQTNSIDSITNSRWFVEFESQIAVFKSTSLPG